MAVIKVWKVQRDGLDVAECDSHKQAGRIISSLKRAFPTSEFRAIYTGKPITYDAGGNGVSK